ncbi:hypothetical protein KM043_006128 [Ampulex compressa]|nr:hypothetical protein KM043_006128 [Ampulex compressa]
MPGTGQILFAALPARGIRDIAKTVRSDLRVASSSFPPLNAEKVHLRVTLEDANLGLRPNRVTVDFGPERLDRCQRGSSGAPSFFGVTSLPTRALQTPFYHRGRGLPRVGADRKALLVAELLEYFERRYGQSDVRFEISNLVRRR